MKYYQAFEKYRNWKTALSLSCIQDAYTRVLKGQIDLAMTIFPNTTQGK